MVVGCRGSNAEGLRCDLKVITIGILPQEKLRARAVAVARGRYKPKPRDPKIWFPSMKSLSETLSDKNMELIKIIAEHKPISIAALSQKTGRASSNLSRTLNRLARFGFVTLQKRGLGMW